MRYLPFLLALELVVAGCPTRDQEPAGTGGAAAAGGTGNAGDAGAGGMAAPAPNTVTIISPTTTIYTNGTVTISIATSEPTTRTATLVATGPSGPETVGSITPPQTSFTWNTSGAAEGTYSITAQLPTNGTTATSNAITVIVDRTPPQVDLSSLVPSIGASNVVLAAPIQASFSEPVLASTVSPAAIPIETASGSALPTTVSVSPDGKTVTVEITTSRGVALSEALSASFTSAITDLAGNALLPLSTTWSWDVPAWVEYAPIPSAANGGLLLAIGTNYQPIVAYDICGVASGGACNPLLHVAVSDGEAWNDLGEVVGGLSAASCALFVDKQNNPTVAWGDTPSSEAASVAFSTWNGSAWTNTTYPAIGLTATQGTGIDAIAAVLDGMGHPFLAYRGDVYTPATSSNIFVAAWTGAAWDSSYGSIDDTDSSSFDLVLNGAGEPVVTVVNSDSSSGAYVWSGTAWSFAGGASASEAAATIDSTGNPVMLTGASSTWVPVHLSGGTWLPIVSAPVAQSANSSDPNITSDVNQQPVVAWYSPSTTTPGIGLARWTGTSWDDRPGLATAGATPAAALPALAVDGRNGMWIGWSEGTNVNVWMSNY